MGLKLAFTLIANSFRAINSPVHVAYDTIHQSDHDQEPDHKSAPTDCPGGRAAAHCLVFILLAAKPHGAPAFCPPPVTSSPTPLSAASDETAVKNTSTPTRRLIYSPCLHLDPRSRHPFSSHPQLVTPGQGTATVTPIPDPFPDRSHHPGRMLLPVLLLRYPAIKHASFWHGEPLTNLQSLPHRHTDARCR